jgi:hypothetical protein
MKKIKLKLLSSVFVTLFIGRMVGTSQGFVNLNFEEANLSGYVPHYPLPVPFTNAFPGWSDTEVSTFYGTNANLNSFYDGVSTGGAGISISDSNNLGFAPFQGKFFGSSMGAGGPLAISEELSQTGLVPVGTESITMDVYAWNGFSVTLGGQTINMIPLKTFTNYTLYGGDISMFAGQIAALDLIAPGTLSPNAVEFDKIQFSTNIVPEPSDFALIAIGVIFYASTCANKFFRAAAVAQKIPAVVK